MPCPKRMIYGPCGGVRHDGGCEVAGVGPCVFLDGRFAEPEPPTAAGRRPPHLGVVTDLHVRPRDRRSVEAFADRVAGSCAAVLVPDHGARHGDFPPAYLASILIRRGVRPWVTLACRDRNRAALAAELTALADMGVPGVHCVTGDWQETAERQVFDLDAVRLVELAANTGLAVSVAATPGAPPVEARPALLAAKAAAGATVAFVNHCGGPSVVAPFVAAAGDAGADLQIVACVPVLSDQATVASLARLPGLVLDAAATAAEVEGDPVPAAVTAARAMLAVPGVTGVNLSGVASRRSAEESAEAMAAVGREVSAHVGA